MAHEWKQVCVWLCGWSRGFWPMWHVYCLGDLGQWSTSGTSHNRVHTSTVLRHPTGRVVTERGKGKETSGFSLSLSLLHTHTHLYIWLFLDSSRCIWTSGEEQQCVSLMFVGGMGRGWLTALNQNVPRAGWVTLPSYSLSLFCLLFNPILLPPFSLCSIISPYLRHWHKKEKYMFCWTKPGGAFWGLQWM